jgi:hypothetical protein
MSRAEMRQHDPLEFGSSTRLGHAFVLAVRSCNFRVADL